MSLEVLKLVCGGETGIRTLDTLSSMPPFQGGTFNHSAISPHHSRAFLNLPQLKATMRESHFTELARRHFASRLPLKPDREEPLA
jgi:hypothetical protein